MNECNLQAIESTHFLKKCSTWTKTHFAVIPSRRSKNQQIVRKIEKEGDRKHMRPSYLQIRLLASALHAQILYINL